MRTLIVVPAAALTAGCFGGLRNEAPGPLACTGSTRRSLRAGATLPADLSIVVERDGAGPRGRRHRGPMAGQAPRLHFRRALGERRHGAPAVGAGGRLPGLGSLRSVQGEVGRFSATHTLAIEVRRFEADYTGGGPPVAQVELAATLGPQLGPARADVRSRRARARAPWRTGRRRSLLRWTLPSHAPPPMSPSAVSPRSRPSPARALAGARAAPPPPVS